MIDWNTSRIELQKKTTKNKTARYLPIYGDRGPEIDMALFAADPACPFLIQHEGSRSLISRNLGRQRVRPPEFQELYITICAGRRSRT
jgi:hypothetical protein